MSDAGQPDRAEAPSSDQHFAMLASCDDWPWTVPLPIAPPSMTKPEMSNTRRGTSVRADGDTRTAEQIRNEAYAKLLKANNKKK
jgi:hypothetical protein